MTTTPVPQKPEKKPADRRKKFVELTNARMSKIIKQIRQIQNLSNKHAYEYTDADVKTIITTLNGLVEQTDLRFKGKENLVDNFDITRPGGVK